MLEAYLDVRVWQKYATTGMTLSGYNPDISNLMIFFILMTVVVQLIKFNTATLPFIQAYRRKGYKFIKTKYFTSKFDSDMDVDSQMTCEI